MQAFNEMQGLEWLAEQHNIQENVEKAQKQEEQILIPEKKRKSRAAKKREKIQQRLQKYETPEARKQRRRLTKQRMKNKQKQEVKGMTKQEVGQFLIKKRAAKQQLKLKMLKARQQGLPIFIDCAYEQQMSQKERRSLGVQIQLIYKGMRHVQNPCSLQICGVGGSIEASLNKMGLINLPIGINHQNVVQMGKKLKKQLIYLSPDAPDELKQVSDSCAYIIGGLVDRSILKNASLNRAKQLGIKAYCLPIGQFMIKRKCLNLDHVALILIKAQLTGNWKQAFYSAAPKRYSKQQQIQQKESDRSQQVQMSQHDESQGLQQEHIPNDI